MVVVDLGKLSRQYNFLPQKVGDCELGVLESTFEAFVYIVEEHLVHRWKIQMSKIYLYCLGLKGSSTKCGKEHQGVLIH